MRADDWKFISGFAATVLLGAMLLYSVYLRDQATAAGPTVDMDRIEKLHDQGVLSLHEASHWESVGEAGQ